MTAKYNLFMTCAVIRALKMKKHTNTALLLQIPLSSFILFGTSTFQLDAILCLPFTSVGLLNLVLLGSPG